MTEYLTTTVSGTDAWGRTKTADIAWRPLTVRVSHGPGGERQMWADEEDAPAFWSEDPAFRTLTLETVPPVAVDGSWREVVRPMRVDAGADPEELRPGEWTLLD